MPVRRLTHHAAHDIQKVTSQPNLILFTDAYPYGSQETFVALELPFLLEAFPSILIVPRTFGDSRKARDVPHGAQVAAPIFSRSNRSYRLIHGLFNTAPFLPLLQALLDERLYRSPGKLIRWMEAASTARKLISHPEVRRLIEQRPQPLWYFYWGAGCAWALPFLPPEIKAVCRFHGFDVYEDRRENRGCMPFQERILERLRMGACIAQHGLEHLQARCPRHANTLSLHRLGVPTMPAAQASDDGVFRILSCSRMVQLKRLDVLAQAILTLEFPVEWRHLGDGPCKEAVKRLVESCPSHIRCVFPGQVNYDELHNTYRDTPVDIFVLISESEGVPVSIMEALGAGVPVLATAVGGVPELVDDTVGQLLSAGAHAVEIADALTGIQSMPDRRQRWALAARERWRECANAETNLKKFVSECSAL
ncbi:MAG: glycosyltransferase [Kiritimatiellia bacterium]|jgi:glycosyltransferase involved in cell wall biosynthesis|nr:glycosyltransferase [Kiritimatiellia bacterium]